MLGVGELQLSFSFNQFYQAAARVMNNNYGTHTIKACKFYIKKKKQGNIKLQF